MADLLLAVLVAGSQAVASWAGWHVTMHPPTDEHQKHRYSAMFLATLFVGFLGTGVLTYRANRSAESIDSSLQRINQTLTPMIQRSFGDTREQMIATLKSAAPPGAVSFGVRNGDSEAENFAQELRSILAEAGWKIGEWSSIISSGPMVGITIEVRDGEFPSAAVLQRVLGNAGFPADGRLRSDMAPGNIRIIVGSKR